MVVFGAYREGIIASRGFFRRFYECGTISLASKKQYHRHHNAALRDLACFWKRGRVPGTGLVLTETDDAQTAILWGPSYPWFWDFQNFGLFLEKYFFHPFFEKNDSLWLHRSYLLVVAFALLLIDWFPFRSILIQGSSYSLFVWFNCRVSVKRGFSPFTTYC